MKKKKKSSVIRAKSINDGFNNLIDVHTRALEENSERIIEALELLKDKKLTESDKKALSKIKSNLKRLNKDIDILGD